MALTDIQLKAAKPGLKPYKLADAKGLHLFVATTGSRSWGMKYRFLGKEKVLTFGPYPEVTRKALLESLAERGFGGEQLSATRSSAFKNTYIKATCLQAERTGER